MRKFYQANLYYIDSGKTKTLYADSRSELVSMLKREPSEPKLDVKKSTIGMPSLRIGRHDYVPIHFEEKELILSAHK